MSFPEVSVVVPLFDEEANVRELHRRLVTALDALDVNYELILVNDGSRDRTAELADSLAADDSRLTVLHLSRNFGHQAAISAGIEHAKGRAVVVMDGDLQDPPEVIAQLLDTWRSGHDVVYAIRTKRKEPLWKRAGYFVFYRLLRSVSDLDIPLDAGDFCLMDRKVGPARCGARCRNCTTGSSGACAPSWASGKPASSTNARAGTRGRRSTRSADSSGSPSMGCSASAVSRCR